MKTRAQKKEQLDKASEMIGTSTTLVFTDFTRISSEKLRELRRELLKVGARMFVIKKRLLNLLMKEKGMEIDTKRFQMSVGTIFSPVRMDEVSTPVFKFFKELKTEQEQILGGYDLEKKLFVEPAEVIMLGQLPPREVLLAQVLGMFVAPLRGFMYVLDQKSKQ